MSNGKCKKEMKGKIPDLKAKFSENPTLAAERWTWIRQIILLLIAECLNLRNEIDRLKKRQNIKI